MNDVTIIDNLADNTLWNTLEITNEGRFITVNGIRLPSDRRTIGWLVNILAVYCNFRKAYMCTNNRRITDDQRDLINTLGLSEHLGNVFMTDETAQYVASCGITSESPSNQLSLKMGEVFKYFIPNASFPHRGQERLIICINMGDYSEIYTNQQINETNIMEFRQHIDRVIDMYQKIINGINMSHFIVRCDVSLLVRNAARIEYNMSLEEFYNYKIHPNRHITVEHVFL